MKKIPTIFLQIVVVLVGVVAFVFMLWEPHLEGRNVNATVFQIYFNDPFLAYAYIASIAFFVALYQAFKILGFVRQNKTFSQATLKAVQTIRHCAMSLVGFVVGAEAYFFIAVRGKDDIAGGVAMGLFMIFTFTVVAAKATMFEQILQNALDAKLSNK